MHMYRKSIGIHVSTVNVKAMETYIIIIIAIIMGNFCTVLSSR